jgi:putative FmdB family regulatory protein
MPIYQYKCKCSEAIIDFERSIMDPESIKYCDLCSKELKRVYGTFGVQLKGSGWYSTGG